MALEDTRLGELRSVLVKVVTKSFTKNQLNILAAVGADTKCMSKTSVVKSVASDIGCAESTVWDAVSLFQELGLVECDRNSVRLTNTRRFCSSSGDAR